jgi:uncharacterized coiled-coil protein SlyX
MRFNREDLDTDNPQALLQGMNRQVVYYRGDDDITSPVLEALNNKFKKAQDAGGDRPSNERPPVQDANRRPANNK